MKDMAEYFPLKTPPYDLTRATPASTSRQETTEAKADKMTLPTDVSSHMEDSESGAHAKMSESHGRTCGDRGTGPSTDYEPPKASYTGQGMHEKEYVESLLQSREDIDSPVIGPSAMTGPKQAKKRGRPSLAAVSPGVLATPDSEPDQKRLRRRLPQSGETELANRDPEVAHVEEEDVDASQVSVSEPQQKRGRGRPQIEPMIAQVKTWDFHTNKHDGGRTRSEGKSILIYSLIRKALNGPVITYPRKAIENAIDNMGDIQVKLVETLDLGFLGTGVIHLSPKCIKEVENSNEMSMVFFVLLGRVTVNVGTPPTAFSMAKGSQWTVPQGRAHTFVNRVLPAIECMDTIVIERLLTPLITGNFYSIKNDSDNKSARCFYAQGRGVQTGTPDEKPVP